MRYRLLADAVLLLHAAFIGYAVLGALLVRWRRWLIWPHLACAAWASAVVIMGWVCPLTPLEQQLRQLAGQQGYSTSFIEHYLLTAIYPEGLTRGIQIALGVGVLVTNALLYGWVWRFYQKNSA